MVSAGLGLIDPQSDADGDGLTFIEEHAFGSDPDSAASVNLPESIIV